MKKTFEIGKNYQIIDGRDIFICMEGEDCGDGIVSGNETFFNEIGVEFKVVEKLDEEWFLIKFEGEEEEWKIENCDIENCVMC